MPVLVFGGILKKLLSAGFDDAFIGDLDMESTESHKGKVVGRTVAIVLGLTCAVLVAGLVAVTAVYMPTASTINDLKVENARLKGNMTALTNQISTLQNTLNSIRRDSASKENQIAALQTSNNDLTNIVNMNASTIITQGEVVQVQAGTNVTVFNDFINYAGYFSVRVTSLSNTTFAQVLYTSSGVEFDKVTAVGEDGIANFPVLPGSIEVRVGDTEAANAVDATVSILYVY